MTSLLVSHDISTVLEVGYLLSMISYLKHLWRRAASKRREKKKDATRSPKWRTVKNKHLLLNPSCAGCGSKKHLQVHHIVPFAVNPALELDSTNLVSACMDRPECHLRICHADNFRSFNPNVVDDLSVSLKTPWERSNIWKKAKASAQKAVQAPEPATKP